jgi:lysyl-tRNA synthetase, class II
MSTLERVPQQRLEKLENLKSRGVDPYPPRFHRSQTNAEAVELLKKQEESQGQPAEVVVAGRITANRSMGKLVFMDLQDGSGRLQLFINKPKLDEASAELIKDLDIGDFLGAAGTMVRTRTGEPSVDVKAITLLSKSLQPLPEKWHGLQDTEKRYRQRYLDLIANPEVREVFRRRSRIVSSIRCYLEKHDFLEVETPMLQPSAGGALARPFITHHNALDCNFYLRIALELHLKRLIVGGFDRVYEIGRVFRNEGIDTRHNPEFTMLEAYQAYADYREIMTLVEQMIASAVKDACGGYTLPFGEHTIDFTPPWKRLDLREGIKEASGIDYDEFPDTASLQVEMRRRGYEFDPARDRGRLIDDLLSTFLEPKLIQPTFLVDYPIDMSPLAKNRPGDTRTVERFEAYAGHMEIANAFSELNDPLEQERRFARQLEGKASICRTEAEETEVIDEDFLIALEHGMPPTGGLGVGIDRISMLLTNQQSIREVILFPALKDKG